MNKTKIMCLSLAAVAMMSLSTLASCGGKGKSATQLAIEEAQKMDIADLEAKAKAEMEASDDTFKIVALTSTMASAYKEFQKTYTWLTDKKVFCKNDYKDAALLTALEQADTTYFADFALIQDARSLADLIESGITHNYVPKDWKELGLAEEDTLPLKGIHFNKIFFVNNTAKLYTEKKFNNVWQLAGKASDEGHLDNFSFQNPVTEQINLSFLLSLMSEKNAPMLKTAYKDYYKKDWEASKQYDNIGKQFVYELMANVKVWHGSDGTAMKATQYSEKIEEEEKNGVDPFVYYGAFAKMKDAAKIETKVTGEDGKETTVKGLPMKTVGWDLELSGFNSFMYTMYSQVVNNAKHPYTACLFARFILTPDCYKAMCYNSLTPNSKGEKSNMYGYYYPCTNKDGVGYNDLDWSRDKWYQKSVMEDYNYLKDVKSSTIEDLRTYVNGLSGK